MKQKTLMILLLVVFISSCGEKEKVFSSFESNKLQKWDRQKLQEKAIQHLDSTQWDLSLFQQDIETYKQYFEAFRHYPLNKTPFPVAQYDYSVSSIPFQIETNESILKGVSVGEYESMESEKIIHKLTLLLLSNDKKTEEATLVDSRNYPYLTAQGIFKAANQNFDWVFSASPDGYSTLLFNMKLFDLRFGETIVIYPQIDQSFFYEQINDSPNHYETFDAFKESVLTNSKVKSWLTSIKNKP